jgi:hypothetical protein
MKYVLFQCNWWLFIFLQASSQAKHRVVAMEQTISLHDGDVQNLIAERAEATRRMLELNEELDKYRALLGPSSSPDLVDLTRLLKEKEDELEKLRLLELQRGEVGLIILLACVGTYVFARLKSHYTPSWKKYRALGRLWIDRSRAKHSILHYWRRGFRKVRWM